LVVDAATRVKRSESSTARKAGPSSPPTPLSSVRGRAGLTSWRNRKTRAVMCMATSKSIRWVLGCVFCQDIEVNSAYEELIRTMETCSLQPEFLINI